MAAPSRAPRTRIGTWLARPLASFHLIVTIAFLLTVLGLVMVLSSSSVESYANDGSAYALFLPQLMYAVLGAVFFYIALCIPIRVLRKWSFPAFAACMVLLALVLIPGVGNVAQGSRRWLVLGPFSVQPSELIKVALALWGAHLLASRRREGRGSLKEILVPLVPAGLLACVMVVLQPNLSTTIALGIILGALLWYGGLPLKVFGSIVVGGVVAAGVLAVSAGYRSNRVRAFFNPGEDPQGINYQARQAAFSLADGGFLGRGLGQSRAKWSYLPNAHNDFIFAIIGEELGFLGCLAVLGLFGLFVYTGLRIAARSVDPFLRLLTATATTWILGQAMINIGYVIGLLPVTGLQLPLVSAGGSSLAITLFMFGVLANAARHEPEAIAALHAGQDGRISKMLRLRKPEPYAPVSPSSTRAVAVRRAQERSRSGRGAAGAPVSYRSAQGRDGREGDRARDRDRRAADPGRSRDRRANEGRATGSGRGADNRRARGDRRAHGERRAGERGNRR
ncbi:putative lipid II flippase FtsW [Rhodococcus triatomae]|uniref:Probable peptidoglycan glycosyltransferase FtsW n=1 Tax=Rhodococcus triatomae TaxID=300028 RepID=A0A1G8D2B4_9NOCA|nr:putative lipid II flippase FtsW [Rhodococcus triatomae]QNG18531.1 putative lipid II flippase FtsW [Rhodococcus triatomae]QNG21800.1 putative lipid II flippase FtsW [Rhodococcus triatomae]SDH51674.1 cell division protein FtsW [Rhodococcus triatomae]